MNTNILTEMNRTTMIIPTPDQASNILNMIQTHQATTVRLLQQEQGAFPLVFHYTKGQVALLTLLEIMANVNLTTQDKMAAICNFSVEDFLLAQMELRKMMEVE